MAAEPVIVEAVRTPIGKRAGALANLHPAYLLGETYRELLGRTGIHADCVEQIVGGTVTHAGEQSMNPARNAWLAVGLPYETAATTVDCQCGSSQQANHMVANMVAAGVIDVGIGCGVEAMSRVPLGSGSKHGPGKPWPDEWNVDLPNQFEAAERIARARGLTRERVDSLGLLSQERAATAWAEERYKRETFAVQVPTTEEEQAAGQGMWRLVDRDEGLRDTTMEGLAGLKPVMPAAVHTAGNSSQISDGAAAVMWASKRMARAPAAAPRQDRRAGTGRRRPALPSRRADRRHPCGARQGRDVTQGHRPRGGQRGVRLRRAVLGTGLRTGSGEGECERRGHRPRPPRGGDGRPPDHDGAARTGAA